MHTPRTLALYNMSTKLINERGINLAVQWPYCKMDGQAGSGNKIWPKIQSDMHTFLNI